MARMALADLLLDTIGWHNGHSTTNDMLWAGVPVLTTELEARLDSYHCRLITRPENSSLDPELAKLIDSLLDFQRRRRDHAPP